MRSTLMITENSRILTLYVAKGKEHLTLMPTVLWLAHNILKIIKVITQEVPGLPIFNQSQGLKPGLMFEM